MFPSPVRNALRDFFIVHFLLIRWSLAGRKDVSRPRKLSQDSENLCILTRSGLNAKR